MSVTSGGGLVSQEEKFGRVIAGDSYKSYIRLQTNDFAYNKSSTKDYPQGYIARYDGFENAAVPNSIFSCFRPDKEKVDPDYLDHLFHGNHHGHWLRRYITVGARANGALSVSDDALMSMPIPLPAITEQQKIAACLSSLDAVIAAQSRALDALRRHKRGMMQGLFPREGEPVPRLRFPEFRDAGAWKWKPLEKLAEITLGKMLDKNKYRTGHRLPYLNNLSVRWNDFDLSSLPEMYFSDDDLDRYDLRARDVVVCEGGEPGRAAVWDERVPGIKFQKALHRVRFMDGFVPQLLVYYLETIAGTARFESLFTGGGIKHLTRQTFARLQIPVAVLAEQQKIAACLSSLDAAIAAQSRALDALRQHKRGLMQGLFPRPEDAQP